MSIRKRPLQILEAFFIFKRVAKYFRKRSLQILGFYIFILGFYIFIVVVANCFRFAKITEFVLPGVTMEPLVDFFSWCKKTCPEIQNTMSQVNVQAKTILEPLRPLMPDITDTQITEPPFSIMRREVTVGEFKQYYNELSPSQQQKIGQEWQQGADNMPVASIPWEAADGYAKWLSEKTGCLLALPTRNQWKAAVIQYAKPEEANVRKRDKPKLQQRDEKLAAVVDLLGNLREWSQEKCSENNHYTLGEDYKTFQKYIEGKPICLSDKLDTIGFRLVLQENNQEQHK